MMEDDGDAVVDLGSPLSSITPDGSSCQKRTRAADAGPKKRRKVGVQTSAEAQHESAQGGSSSSSKPRPKSSQSKRSSGLAMRKLKRESGEVGVPLIHYSQSRSGAPQSLRRHPKSTNLAATESSPSVSHAVTKAPRTLPRLPQDYVTNMIEMLTAASRGSTSKSPRQNAFAAGCSKGLAQPIVESADDEEVSTTGGISSSKFARVMRLVADLPRLDVPTKKEKRPKPTIRPPVWAEVGEAHFCAVLTRCQSRQELCEALPYYRAYQAGLYMSGRIAFGYLLEAFPAP